MKYHFKKIKLKKNIYIYKDEQINLLKCSPGRQIDRCCYSKDRETERRDWSQYQEVFLTPEFEVPRAEPLCLTQC